MYLASSPFTHGNSLIHRLDPRVKLSIAWLFALLMAVSTQFPSLFWGLGYALFLVFLARLPLAAMQKRFRTLNLFTLLIFLVLPFTTPGSPWFYLGNLVITQEGVLQATVITLKSNAILLAVTALVSTVETITLGHALYHLRVPDKLIHLLLFTIRYIEVLYREYQRLVKAMKVRGFQARFNWHTYRSLAYLVGMLLVKSLDRSERILAAMKCRGFHGQLFLLKHFSLQRHDKIFGVVSIVLLLGLVGSDIMNNE
jgi:cobalt/nickel transport system permease protein